MSHVIQMSACSADPGRSQTSFTSPSRVLLFRECATVSSESKGTKVVPPWRCAVLGLPNEILHEDFAMFLEPYSSEISSVEMIDDCSTRTDSNPQRDTNVASLSCATAATAADEDIDSQVTEVRQSATIADSSCSSSKIAIIEFINESSLREFSSLYNNLHFPMFKDVPPCIVVPLKMCLGKDDMVINSENFSPRSTGINVGSQIPDQIDRGSVHDEEADEGSRQQTDVVVDNSNRCRLSWVELPTCTVCLRRLQCSASGIEGGNDIPVSMWFSGNTARCKACKVYGEGAETVGSGISKPNSQLRHCNTCGLWGNIWACLVCAHTGCGRYAMRHAEQHFRETQHSFSLELATGRIWDYKEDNFVHVEGEWGRWGECAYDPESDEEGGIPCNQTPTAHVSGTTSVSSQWRDLDKDEWPTSSKCSAKFPNHVTVSASVSATASSNESDYMSMTEGHRVRRHPKQRPSQNFRHRPEHRLDTVTVDKMGCLMESYENLLEGQLADQQIFFEKKLAKETILALEESLRRGRYSNSNQLVAASCNAINEVTVAPNNSSGSSSDRKCIDGSVSSPKEPGSGRDSSVDFEAVDAQLAGVEISKIEISALEHEYSLILSKLKEVEAQGRAVRRLNETLIREQKVLRDRVEVLNRSEEETKRQCEEQVSELEQQIRDLCFYTKMKNQVASSPLKEELAGGSMVVPMGIPTVAGTKKKVPLSSHKKPR